MRFGSTGRTTEQHLFKVSSAKPPATQDTMLEFTMLECPACSRRLRVLSKYLDEQVACGHCGCNFTASTHENNGSSDSLLQRAERLLADYELRR